MNRKKFFVSYTFEIAYIIKKKNNYEGFMRMKQTVKTNIPK